MSYLKASIISIIAVLAPIKAIMITVGIMIAADMVLGILASRKRKEKISSAALRRTVSKAIVYQIAILTGFLCETYLIGELVPITKILASVIGLVEMKSILENADEINGSPIFKSIIKTLGSKNDAK